MHSSEDEGDSEEGESDMEEGESAIADESGEYEWEEMESESYESSDEKEAPQLVPIEDDRSAPKADKKRSKSVPITRKTFQSDSESESEQSEEEDVDDLSSSALDEAI
jgi:hypothetical protein